MPKLRKPGRDMNSIEVAWFLDMSPDDVTVLARRGTLRGRKVGRQWRFQRRDVRFLEKRLKPGG